MTSKGAVLSLEASKDGLSTLEDATIPVTGLTDSMTSSAPSTMASKNKMPRKRKHNSGRGTHMKNPFLQQKSEEIELLLGQPEIDLWKLREFALSPGGLVNDTIRKRAWPKLVGLDHNYDPLPLDDIVLEGNPVNAEPASGSSHQPQQTTTIEIDAQHELLQPTEREKKAIELPPMSTLLVESMDSAQIDRDVARCTWHLLTGSQRSRRSQHRSITHNSTRGTSYHQSTNPAAVAAEKLKTNRQHTAKYRRNRKIAVLMKKKQNRLANLINLTLVHSYDRSDSKKEGEQSTLPGLNRLRYYQGYHDVACIFLHALGGAGTNQSSSTNFQNRHYSSGDLELPSKVLCQVSFSHFKDALRSDFLRLQTGLKLMLFPLLRKIDSEVHDHLLDADMEPFFCLSWILTWFAHDVRDTNLVKRLFDAFLVAHPALPVYASLAMITHPHNRRLILETDCDFAALHQCLASLPKHSCKVGYKEQKIDGAFGNIVTYVSDDEGETHEEPSGETILYAGGDNNTITTNMDSYLDEQQSEFDDDDSRTFDTRSHYTSETFCTESSFPTSVQSSSVVSTATPSLHKGNASIASGSLMGLQEDEDYPASTDRTLISTEQPDFMSKESTLVSGTWNDAWIDDVDAGSNRDAAGNPVIATASSHVLNDINPVPFESVLETALQFMKLYPPSSLVDLAKKYYQDDWDSQLSLLAATNQSTDLDVQQLIGLLQPTPPAWSILPWCTSDWVDKQKVRQDLGLKPTSRKDRRRRNHMKHQANMSIDWDDPDLSLDMDGISDTRSMLSSTQNPMEYIRLNPENIVVAAVGYSIGIEARKKERQRLRRQRKLERRKQALVMGCGVVLIGAFLYKGVQYHQPTEHKPCLLESDAVAPGSSSCTKEETISCSAIGKSASKKDNHTKESDTMKTAAKILLPRVMEQFSAQQQEAKRLPGSPKTVPTTTSKKSILPPSLKTKTSSRSVASTVSNTKAMGGSDSQSLDVLVPRQTEEKQTIANQYGANGTTILLRIIDQTKFVTFRFFRNVWKVCKGFVLKFHVFPFRKKQR